MNNQESFKNTLKNKHDFILVNVDTDSISFARKDGSPITKEDRDFLLKELNSEYPNLINFGDDGYFDRGIVVASKNYVFLDPNNPNPKKREIKKGATLKATRKEIYLKDFLNQFVAILKDKNWTYNQVIDLYNKTAKECIDLPDMSRHAYKVAITDKVLNGDRTIALRVKVALRGVNYQQGDKFRMFFLPDGNLCLESNFKGIYDERRLLKKLWDTVQAFADIMPMDNFPNYALLKNYYEFSGKSKPVKARKGTKIAKDVD